MQAVFTLAQDKGIAYKNIVKQKHFTHTLLRIKHVDGLSMPFCPLLSKGWLSQRVPDIKGDSEIYFLYMDYIFRKQTHE